MVARLAPLLGKTVSQLKAAINNQQYSPYVPGPGRCRTPRRSRSSTCRRTRRCSRGCRPRPCRCGPTARWARRPPTSSATWADRPGPVPAAQVAGLPARRPDRPGRDRGRIRERPARHPRGDEGPGRLAGQRAHHPQQHPADPGRRHPADHRRPDPDGRRERPRAGHGRRPARPSTSASGRNFTAPAGSAVVEDPNNGQILALATNPTYDPSEFVGGISQANYQALLNNPSDPLLDRTIQGQYAPGSTFKLVTATAGLQYGLITPTTYFDDTGSITIGNFVAHNDNGAAYGAIDLPTAITVSSDNYFNTIGLQPVVRPGPVRRRRPAERGQRVRARVSRRGIALPNEAAGKIPTPASYVRDHEPTRPCSPSRSGIPATATRSPSGRTRCWSPRCSWPTPTPPSPTAAPCWCRNWPSTPRTPHTGGSSKVYPSRGPSTRSDLQPAWRAAMLQGFTGVVNNPSGTAYGDFAGTPLANMDIAGKTGTAQVNAPRQDTSVFTSFAPAQQPRVRGRRVHGGRRLRGVGGGAGGAGDLRRPVQPAAAARRPTPAPGPGARTDARRDQAGARPRWPAGPQRCSGSTSIRSWSSPSCSSAPSAASWSTPPPGTSCRRPGSAPTYYLKKQVIFMVVGVVVMAGRGRHRLPPLPGLGRRHLRAQRAHAAGRLRGGPQEPGRPGLVPDRLLPAGAVGVRQDRADHRPGQLLRRAKGRLSLRGLLVVLVLSAIPFVLIYKQPDLGTALVLAAVLVAVLLIGGASGRHLVAAGGDRGRPRRRGRPLSAC